MEGQERPHPDGLRSLKIGLSGLPFSLKAAAKDVALTGIVAGASPLAVALQIGDDLWQGEVPCATSASGSTVKCR